MLKLTQKNHLPQIFIMICEHKQLILIRNFRIVPTLKVVLNYGSYFTS